MTLTSVGILIFDQVEVLDFCGPLEVFSSASLPGTTSTYPESQLYQVHLIAKSRESIRTVGGMTVTPHCSIDDHPEIEILVVPGGYGTRRIELDDERVIAWIAEQRKRIALVTSVCTGAFLLARAGVLTGQRATTHWGSVADLAKSYPELTVTGDERVVDLGPVITSAGVSAGIDMALHVVSRQHGVEAAVHTARDMEYRWEPTA